MDTSILSAKDRQQLEELLDQFDRALKNCRDGKLPDVDEFLAEYQGKERKYLRREMEAIEEDLIRGEYIKLRRIGGGGMGEVFLARHVALGREFALKEIKLECLQQGARREFESRFKREIEACGRLENHPNIVSVTNAGTSQSGIPYLVMEYIDGEDLKQLIENNGPPGIGYACKIIHDAAVGLAHAHEKGLVHRDIKPSNLMVSKHGVVTVLDLGLARVIESDRQATFVSVPGLVGSFDYMSPEQCREQTDIDTRADVYSLGCTLYFLLAGKPPFAESTSIFQKLNAHQKNEIPLIELLADLPELWQILEHMLAKQPEDRYQQIDEVAVDLEKFTHGLSLRSLAKPGSTAPMLDDSGAHITKPFPSVGTYVAQSTTVANHPPELGRRKFLSVTAAITTAAAVGTAVYFWPKSPLRGRFIGTLPGLNGRWWFEEVPWLLPEVRLHLMQQLTTVDAKNLFALARGADTPAFYQNLKQKVQAIGPSSEEAKELFIGLSQLDPEKDHDDAIHSSLQEASSRILATESQQRLAVDQHLLAIIYHHRDDFANAQTAYQAAFTGYEEGFPLRALCLSDWGHMLVKHRKSTQAMVKFQLSREALRDDSSQSQLFRLHALCMEADAHRRIPNWESALQRLREAKLLAENLETDHPLRSVYEERCGWYHLGAWHLSEAEDNFSRAKTSRKANLTDDNFRALHFEYWDRQGQAMVNFYRGNISLARTEFETMLTDIVNNRQLTPKLNRELRSREPNLNERLADTNLVSMLFDENRLPGAAKQLDEAILRAKGEGFESDGRATILIRLKYKALLVWSLMDDKPAAKKCRDEVLAWEKKLKRDDATKRRVASFDLTKQLALAYFKIAFLDSKPRVDNGLLSAFAKNPSVVGRDDLLLLLVVGLRLLRSDWIDDKIKTRLAERLETLAQVRPRGEPVPGVGAGTKAKNPGLFELFRDKLRELRGENAG